MIGKIVLLTLLLCVFVSVECRPQYVIIPIEELEYLEHQASIPLHRVRRQAVRFEDAPANTYKDSQYDNNEEVAEYRPYQEEYAQDQRTAPSEIHGHHASDDHVDYGAYTGGYGAFGWYSDHPVIVYHRR